MLSINYIWLISEKNKVFAKQQIKKGKNLSEWLFKYHKSGFWEKIEPWVKLGL